MEGSPQGKATDMLCSVAGQLFVLFAVLRRRAADKFFKNTDERFRVLVTQPFSDLVHVEVGVLKECLGFFHLDLKTEIAKTDAGILFKEATEIFWAEENGGGRIFQAGTLVAVARGETFNAFHFAAGSHGGKRGGDF